ncbi:MAG: hypothetical protein H3Z53_11255 [archaeon]|nr:hypothetical protein [archaeon]MCP8314929.1 hypothetical protein [archaeon]
MESNNHATADKPCDFEAKAYEIIVRSGDQGISQADLWRILRTDSREGSRIARRLENKKKIKRVKVLKDGRWTYRLIKIRSIQELLDVKIPERLDTPSPNEIHLESELAKAWQWQKSPGLQIGRLSLDRALDELDRVLSSLGLGMRTREVADEAHAIFRKAVAGGFGIGRRGEVLMAASLHAACRRLGVPVHLNDICQRSKASRRIVTACYRSMREAGIFEAPVPNLAIHLDRIIGRLEKDELCSCLLTADARSKALQMIEKAQSLGITAGKDPAGFAAASLYLACDGYIPQGAIARAAAVTEVTVRNNCKRLKELTD